jgi:hypothetical protein
MTPDIEQRERVVNRHAEVPTTSIEKSDPGPATAKVGTPMLFFALRLNRFGHAPLQLIRSMSNDSNPSRCRIV